MMMGLGEGEDWEFDLRKRWLGMGVVSGVGLMRLVLGIGWWV